MTTIYTYNARSLLGFGALVAFLWVCPSGRVSLIDGKPGSCRSGEFLSYDFNDEKFYGSFARLRLACGLGEPALR